MSLHLSWIKHNILTRDCQPLHHWALELLTWKYVMFYGLNFDSGEFIFTYREYQWPAIEGDDPFYIH